MITFALCVAVQVLLVHLSFIDIGYHQGHIWNLNVFDFKYKVKYLGTLVSSFYFSNLSLTLLQVSRPLLRIEQGGWRK